MKDFGPVHQMLEDMIKCGKKRHRQSSIGPCNYDGPDWIYTKEVLEKKQAEKERQAQIQKELDDDMLDNTEDSQEASVEGDNETNEIGLSDADKSPGRRGTKFDENMKLIGSGD